MDMPGLTFTGSVALVGINPEAATAIMMVTFFLGVFQHLNAKTPQWLDCFVQRPESYSVHHGLGVHRNNYADLPVIDILFGTFVNSKEAVETGFYQGASYRVGDILLFKDVYQEDASTEAADLM